MQPTDLDPRTPFATNSAGLESPSGLNAPPTDLPRWGGTPADVERKRAISRTESGLALLVVSVLLQWIPVIQYVGLFLGAVAVFLILLGRAAFGPRHAWLVWASVGIFVAGEIAAYVLFVDFAAALAFESSSAYGPGAGDAVLSTFDAFLTNSIVVECIISVSFALIAFDLMDKLGRILVVTGVVAQAVVSVAIFALFLLPIINQAVTEAFASNPMNTAPLVAADAQIHGFTALTLLNAIPALLFAGGYVRAYGRALRMAVAASGATPAPAPPRWD